GCRAGCRLRPVLIESTFLAVTSRRLEKGRRESRPNSSTENSLARRFAASEEESGAAAGSVRGGATPGRPAALRGGRLRDADHEPGRVAAGGRVRGHRGHLILNTVGKDPVLRRTGLILAARGVKRAAVHGALDVRRERELRRRVQIEGEIHAEVN